MNEAPNTEGTKSKGAIVSDYGDTGRAGISRPSRLERMQNMTLVLRASRKVFSLSCLFHPRALLHLWSFNFNQCLLDSYRAVGAGNTKRIRQALCPLINSV